MLATALVDDGAAGESMRARLRSDDLSAPEVIDLEVTSVVRRKVAARELDIRRADLALRRLAALPMRRARHRPLMARCWELRENVTTYDGVYVALAEMLDAPLVTGDARLARAPGPRCTFELLR